MHTNIVDFLRRLVSLDLTGTMHFSVENQRILRISLGTEALMVGIVLIHFALLLLLVALRWSHILLCFNSAVRMTLKLLSVNDNGHLHVSTWGSTYLRMNVHTSGYIYNMYTYIATEMQRCALWKLKWRSNRMLKVLKSWNTHIHTYTLYILVRICD